MNSITPDGRVSTPAVAPSDTPPPVGVAAPHMEGKHPGWIHPATAIRDENGALSYLFVRLAPDGEPFECDGCNKRTTRGYVIYAAEPDAAGYHLSIAGYACRLDCAHNTAAAQEGGAE